MDDRSRAPNRPGAEQRAAVPLAVCVGLAPAARFHRPELMPVVGADAIVAWLSGQAGYAAGESRFAEVSKAGDLGYTYGTYALKGDQASRGFYVRVWTRGRDGVWRVVLD